MKRKPRLSTRKPWFSPRTLRMLGLATYVLAVFMIFFGLQALMGYLLLRAPLAWPAPFRSILSASASVVVAIGAALIFPHVRTLGAAGVHSSSAPSGNPSSNPSGNPSSAPSLPSSLPSDKHRALNPFAATAPNGAAVTLSDVTQELARQHRIHDGHELTHAILASAPFSIIATDPAGTITAMNPAAEDLTRYRRHELVGLHSILLLHDPAEMTADAVQTTRNPNQTLPAGFASLTEKPNLGETDEREWTYIRKDGSRIWVNLAMTALRSHDASITGYLGIAFDITERKRLTDHVHHLAHHDPITGLPNRVLLMDRMRQAIERAKRNDHRIAVLMVDIDRFKQINDSLGHSAGDSLLNLVAKKLSSSVRQIDTVARMGGDEFVIILPEFRDLQDAERCARAILQRMSTPILLGKREVDVTVSIGVCLFPDCAHDGDSLLKNADAAMYKAKQSGRNAYHLFSEGTADAT